MTPKQSIFVVSRAGELSRMQPAAPPSEDALQELIERFPDIIADGDGSLLLIRREQPIGDSPLSSGRWAVDHLFVTKDAVPVLVEVKRAVDTRLRREVVGQMLDYAANGVAYWPAGMVEEVFVQRCEQAGEDPDERLAQFLGENADANEFWSQVDANFRAARLKLLFVADEIPPELARIVEFLNEQMTADVRAVELRYFEGEGGFRTLVPRIIGETERANVQKSSGRRQRLEPITLEGWVEKHIAPRGAQVLEGFRTGLSILQGAGAETYVASTQGSVIARVPDAEGNAVTPIYLSSNGTGVVCYGWVWDRVSEEERNDFLARFNDAVGPLSTKNLKGYPGFLVARLADSQKAAEFSAVVRDWLEACRAGKPNTYT